MTTTSHPIGSGLYITSVPVPKASKKKPVPQPVNHIVAIDCSGSMWDDLPLIRTQLKAKLPTLLGEHDTISIVWFSGRGQCDILIEGEAVASVKDLSDLNKAIDRWLKPVCLTGFKEPLQKTAELCGRLKGACSLLFLTDGYDNQWSRNEILTAMDKASAGLVSTTIVEYGYYCNHPLLVSMAETAGGTLIFNEDFKKYEPTFDAAMQRQVLGGKRIEVDLKGDAVKGFAYALDEGSLLTFKVEGGKVTVPEHISEVFFVSPAVVGKETSLIEDSPLYAAIALYAQRVDSDVVLACLRKTGDVKLINEFSGCFGKQKYAAFTELATQATFDESCRLVEGQDFDAVPDDNAFTVLDLLRILSGDGDNRLLLDSKDFRYSKIGRAREQTIELSEDDQTKVDELKAELEGADPKIAKKLQKQIDAIVAAAQPLKFKADPTPNGVGIDNLIFNETRPNVSVQTRREGVVDLKARKGKDHKKVPDLFRTFVFRNYTIIRDGLVNVERLPLRLTGGTVRDLLAVGMPLTAIRGVDGETDTKARARVKKAGKEREVNLVIDLNGMPILNRSMVQEISAENLFKTQYELTQARAAQKVFSTFHKNEFGGRASEGFKVLYGEESAAWLKEQGLTDYSGFSPKGKTAEAKDVYIGKELKVSLKGLSSLPSVKDVVKRVEANKKLTASQSLMQPHMEAVAGYLDSDAHTKAKDKPKVYRAWLESEQADAKKTVRGLLYDVSQIRFGIIVGQTWPKEFDSLDEDTLDITVGDLTIQGKLAMKEIEVPV